MLNYSRNLISILQTVFTCGGNTSSWLLESAWGTLSCISALNNLHGKRGLGDRTNRRAREGAELGSWLQHSLPCFGRIRAFLAGLSALSASYVHRKGRSRSGRPILCSIRPGSEEYWSKFSAYAAFPKTSDLLAQYFKHETFSFGVQIACENKHEISLRSCQKSNKWSHVWSRT